MIERETMEALHLQQCTFSALQSTVAEQPSQVHVSICVALFVWNLLSSVRKACNMS